ncbi:hypothetical protein [Streptomyces sp. NPDC003635]
MPDNRLPRPDDAAIQAAMDRARSALAALLRAVGEGSHQLSIAVDRVDDTIVMADFHVSLGAPGSRDREEVFLRFMALLTFALEGSTARDAVLVALTADTRAPRACGWTVRTGRLHPIDPAELKGALQPCAPTPHV